MESLKKLLMVIDPIWFMISFVGVVFAIGSYKFEAITKWKMLNTFSSGMVMGIVAPVVMRDGFGFEGIAILAVSAMLGSFFGMKITASVLSLDLQALIEKKIGATGKKDSSK